MTLLRSFGQVDEEGRIALGGNFRLQMGLEPDSMAGLEVVRITGSNRSPYLVVHKPDREPRFTALQTVCHQCPCLLDEAPQSLRPSWYLLAFLDVEMQLATDIGSHVHGVIVQATRSYKRQWLLA